MKKLLFVLVVWLLLTGCTENQRAKSLGGQMRIDLPAKTKLVNVTFEGDDLWYVMRPIHDGEKPETLTMQENSSYGLMTGVVTFQEH